MPTRSSRGSTSRVRRRPCCSPVPRSSCATRSSTGCGARSSATRTQGRWSREVYGARETPLSEINAGLRVVGLFAESRLIVVSEIERYGRASQADRNELYRCLEQPSPGIHLALLSEKPLWELERANEFLKGCLQRVEVGRASGSPERGSGGADRPQGGPGAPSPRDLRGDRSASRRCRGTESARAEPRARPARSSTRTRGAGRVRRPSRTGCARASSARSGISRRRSCGGTTARALRFWDAVRTDHERPGRHVDDGEPPSRPAVGETGGGAGALPLVSLEDPAGVLSHGAGDQARGDPLPPSGDGLRGDDPPAMRTSGRHLPTR